MSDSFDLIIVGAGSGGLTAAGFAAKLGRRVALVEKQRIGGDCTWTGCVPSKALIKAARVAHEVRTAAHYGVRAAAPVVEMSQVRAYVQRAIAAVYEPESPEALRGQGLDVVVGQARFTDEHTVMVGDRRLTSKYFLLATGAHAVRPAIPGLADVPYLTYEEIFDNDHLPGRLIVIGAGPIGIELAQAYQRLGAQVTVIGERLLPKEEPEVAALMQRVLEAEGLHLILGRPSLVRREGAQIIVQVGEQAVTGDLLLVATGRTPSVEGLDLSRAGVTYSDNGIQVDEHLRTSARHIYAAGDVVGGYQFTHFAGWQAFQAVRNALLPGKSAGMSDVVPWVTYTDPEVAHVGLTEAAARDRHGSAVLASRWAMARTDRAVCENDTQGFLKIVHKKDGTLLGATLVAGRAGEVISEFVLALRRGLKLADLAEAIHPYPTYSTPVMQLCADITVDRLLDGLSGDVVRGLSRLIR